MVKYMFGGVKMDIGLIGFGGVGQALAGLLIEKRKYLRERYNLEINLKYIIIVFSGW
mgnify:CR=1 FL=1